ncbi:MAG: FAD-dependent monooxygenase [Proteobacteria bacterium]|nr:FAD-dependent monooxygenase [Pseudomonadota bacterium]
MRDTTVTVIGAGIAGLAAALALLRGGQGVRVFESARELGEVGAGLSITPNAGQALVALGLRAELDAMGSRPPLGVMRHYASGKVLVRLEQDQSVAQYGVPLYHVHRADLHRALADAVRTIDPAAIELNHELVAIEQDSRAVQAQFHNGRSISSDWLLGADGIRSVARRALFGPDEPTFTGYVAFRGLVDATELPAEYLDPPLAMTIGPGRLLMRYPLRRGQLLNIVAIARRAAWTEEGWSVATPVSELAAEFADFDPQSRAILSRIPADGCFKWGLFDRDPMPTWTCGRATLAGDAAHAMPPFTGQGAVMALEDGVVLGRAASAAQDIADCLRRYEQARHARTVRALEMSRARAHLYFDDDPGEQVRALGAGMRELRSLYDYDAGRVPV